MSSPKPPAATTPASGGVILIVEDEPSLRESIAYHLKSEGYTVETAADGTRAVAIARERRPDLVLLDVMLPGMNGLQVCRAIRDELNTIIIILSAKGEELDRVLGLELGADDYLAKPFPMRELVARVRAHLRRAARDRIIVEHPVDREEVVVAGDVAVDRRNRSATVNGVPVALKPREFDLLAHLVTHPRTALTRDVLLRDVWGYDFPMDTRTVDVHIRWLRLKLEQLGAKEVAIETVRGHGYRLAIVSTETANVIPER